MASAVKIAMSPAKDTKRKRVFEADKPGQPIDGAYVDLAEAQKHDGEKLVLQLTWEASTS